MRLIENSRLIFPVAVNEKLIYMPGRIVRAGRVSCRYVDGGRLVVNQTVKTLHNINITSSVSDLLIRHQNSLTGAPGNASEKKDEKWGSDELSPRFLKHQRWKRSQTHAEHVKWSSSQEYLQKNKNIHLKRVMHGISCDTCVGEAGKAWI